jgi:hypothetical protein
MNGNPRDSIWTDLEAGRPTISPSGDALARRVMALMSSAEAQALDSRIYNLASDSPALRGWILDPKRYLADLDPACASTIEVLLKAEHDRLVRRAESRGWDVDDKPDAT